MPELPEVHTIIEDLKRSGLVGCHIQKVFVYWPRTISEPSASEFINLLCQKQIFEIKRRGKFIILSLSDHYYLCVHLRMTGHFLMVNQGTPESSYIRLRLDLSNNKSLYFHDTRKFGRWYLVQNPETVVGKIGPEPLSLSFSLSFLEKKLKTHSRALKSLLLDQTFLAGLGNIYVDEALWEACIHPLQPANSLNVKQIEALYLSIPLVLKRGMENQGTTLGVGKTHYTRLDGTSGTHQTLLKVFRRTGQKCRRCSSLIERIVVAQRSTHFCPNCQPLLSN